MKASIIKYLGLSALAAGCGLADGASSRIDVTEKNDLGVTTLETVQGEEHGDAVFTLRGLSAGEREMASVKLTIGEIADIASWLPGEGDLGSEILISATGHDTVRLVTRETQRFVVQSPAAQDSAITQFLELAAVSSTLGREANIIVAKSGVGEPNAQTGNGSERAQATAGCGAGFMLSSPLAKQCCYSATDWPTSEFTLHVGTAASYYAVVRRDRSFWGDTCKSSTGGSCSGANCYWGPFGFARPIVYAATTSYPYIWEGTQTGGEFRCTHAFLSAPEDFYSYPDVTGTLSTGAGCPGGNSSAGAWNY